MELFGGRIFIPHLPVITRKNAFCQSIMNTEKGYASLMEAYNQDLKEKSRSKEELDTKLKWVLDRADAYAEACKVKRDDVLKAWETKRNYWWLNFYQDCNQPDPARMKGTPVVLFEDWMKEGIRLYGPNMLDWRFKCPMCGHVQSLQDFHDVGIEPDNGITCCASRFNLGGNKTCKWTTGGLLRIGGVYVIRPDFVPVLAFAFADTEPMKDRIKVGDAVRIYQRVNHPEARIGEVKEIEDNNCKVIFATIDVLTGKTTIETRLVSPEILAVDRAANEKLHNDGGGIVL